MTSIDGEFGKRAHASATYSRNVDIHDRIIPSMGGITRNDVKRVMGRVFRVRSWKLLLILVPLVFFTATLLRLDHIEMTRLRGVVLKADEGGDAEEIERALVELKVFVSQHIVVNFVERNGEVSLVFGTGQFYLERQYERDAKRALEEAREELSGDDNPNGNVFKKATDVCDPLAKRYSWGYSRPYFDCIMNELARYPSMGDINDTRTALIPPVGEYRLNLASPIWYPSWAGWFVLGCVIMSVVIIIRFLIWGVLRITLITMKKR